MIARATLPSWLRRPAVLAVSALVALAAMLSGGLVVAHAVDGTPTADASPSAAAGGGGNGDNNVAAGVNTTDGRTVYAIKLKIVQVAGDTVDATNAAVAVNSGCTDCSTVAVAFEGVVVVGSPSDFEPTNLALAMNVECSGCTAFADAYQQVVQTSTRVRVTGEGRRQIAAIRRDLDSLRQSDLTLDQIRARVAADEKAFAEVLLTQMTPVGHVTAPAAGGTDVSDTPDTVSTPTPAPTASDAATTTGASPDPSASEAASSPSTEASASPSPTESPTPSASP